MTRRRRIVASLVALSAGAAVPALAELATQRAAEPAQISINTALPAFQVAGLVPGDSMTRCLRVRNEGTQPIALAEAAAVTGELAKYLTIAVEKGRGLGDVGPSCAGFAPSGYGFGTRAGGVDPAALTAESDPAWAAHAEKSLRITIAMPASTPLAAAAKQGTVAFAFAGTPIDGGSGGGGGGDLPSSGGGTTTVPLHGFADDGKNLTNQQVKKLFRVFRPRLLPNGNVVVPAIIPTGGAVRAKVILPDGTYYGHRLYKALHSGHQTALLVRRPVGKVAAVKAKRLGRRLVTTVTFRYRWRHGPDGYAQKNQRFTIVKGR